MGTEYLLLPVVEPDDEDQAQLQAPAHEQLHPPTSAVTLIMVNPDKTSYAKTSYSKTSYNKTSRRHISCGVDHEGSIQSILTSKNNIRSLPFNGHHIFILMTSLHI